jgi:hypothetical protein
MSKGSRPRPVKKTEFDKNYESINWNKEVTDVEVVRDCPVFFRWAKDNPKTPKKSKDKLD